MNGLFINTAKSQCSIYNSGLMIYDALATGPYRLDYVEINKLDVRELYNGAISVWHMYDDELLSSYDFYVFNYHHSTMREVENIDSEKFINLKGKTYCIILEMDVNDPWFFMHPKGFTDYLVIDPTLKVPDNNVHPFPRPLSKFRPIKKIETIPDVPLIGSFGFATVAKGFDLIVKAASEEFEKADIIINLSPSTYARSVEDRYTKEIQDSCMRYVRDGINLNITREYMTENELIEWCGNNTINCFFYTRDLPGLAAASDHAIISGAPLAVSDNRTFRHIHKYIQPYPSISLREAILTSQRGIQQMQIDWSPNKVVEKFLTVLGKLS